MRQSINYRITKDEANVTNMTNQVKRVENIDYNQTPELDRFAFICGLHRSGTTLLERLLTSRYNVAYLRASVSESEGQHMQSVYKCGEEYGGPGRFAFSSQMLRDLNCLTDYDHYRRQLIDEWSHFVVGSSSTLLEKSPPNLTKIGWLRRVFPGSRFVIMTRDPRAVSGATQKWSKTTLPALMMHWNTAYSIAMNDFDERDCTIIRYEDLATDTNTELSRTAAFLDLSERPRSEDLEDRHSKIRNSNAKYFEMHKGTRYGAGIWNRFNYEV